MDKKIKNKKKSLKLFKKEKKNFRKSSQKIGESIEYRFNTPYKFYDFRKQVPVNKAAWITSTNSNYVDGVIKLSKSMKNVFSRFPLICLCTDSTTLKQQQSLNDNGIITYYIPLSSIINPYLKKWTEAFVKIECWKFINFDKVCWIDSDTIQLQNCDELMEIPLEDNGIACAVDHEKFAHDLVRFNMIQTGVFVLRPSLNIYRLLQSELEGGKLESMDGSDQGFLTSFFAENNFQSTVFLSSIYNYMKRGLLRHTEYDIDKIKILHFVGHPKPWDGGEKGYEKLQAIWDKI